MNSEEFTKKYFEMEKSEDLFHTRTLNGEYVWDAIRYDLYCYLYKEKMGMEHLSEEQLIQGNGENKGRNIFRCAYMFILMLFLRLFKPCYLFLSASRYIRDGKNKDILSEELAKHLNGGIIFLETCSMPWRNLFTLPFFRQKKVKNIIPLKDIDVDITISDKIAGLAKKYLDLDLEKEKIGKALYQFIYCYLNNKRYYNELLRAGRPRMIFIVQNGSQKGLFAAANELGIPAVELQHGLFSFSHLNYSYPTGINYEHLKTLPTALFTFGQYWNDMTYFPKAKKIIIGNSEYYSGKVGGRSSNILVISNHIYHEKLAPLAVGLSNRYPQYKILYKIHPQQQQEIDRIRAEFVGHPQITVIGNDLEMKELFSLFEIMIAIESTVVYQALQAGKRVLLFKKSNYLVHRDVFKYLYLFDNLEQLLERIDMDRKDLKGQNVPEFFTPFNRKAFLDAINSLSKKEEQLIEAKC